MTWTYVCSRPHMTTLAAASVLQVPFFIDIVKRPTLVRNLLSFARHCPLNISSQDHKINPRTLRRIQVKESMVKLRCLIRCCLDICISPPLLRIHIPVLLFTHLLASYMRNLMVLFLFVQAYVLSSQRRLVSKANMSEVSDLLSGKGDNLTMFLFTDSIEVCSN